MTPLGAGQVFVMLAVSGFALASNRDILSPVKWYLATLWIFFADIAFSPYPLTVHVTFFCLALLGGVAATAESGLVPPTSATRSGPRPPHAEMARRWWVIWLVSLIPLAAQAYLIYHFGGLAGYFISIRTRVADWAGLGPFVILSGFLSPLTVLYFALGLVSRVPVRSIWWAPFLLHLLLTLALGLLSGGRGSLLGVFVSLMLVFHYGYRRVGVVAPVALGGFILLAAGVLGIARLGYDVTAEGVRTGLSSSDGRTMELTHFRYGLMPLEFIYDRPPGELAGGWTFASALTNFVPRAVWPDKPDGGGVVLTRQMTGLRYRGTAHVAPGIVTESILNFGFLVGVPVGFFILAGAFLCSLALYRRLLTVMWWQPPGPGTLLVLVFFVYLYELPSSLVKGEFTNLVVTKLSVLIFLGGVLWLLLPGRQEPVSEVRP